MPYKIVFLLSLLLLPFMGSAETKLNDIVNSKQKIQTHAQRSQLQIEAIDDKTSAVVSEYRALLRENKVLADYNQQLLKQRQQQTTLLTNLEQSMAAVRTTRMELMPHMQEMLLVLNEFVKQDLPFLWQERQLRLQALTGLLDNPNVTVADKYRRILEAYQIETEYGDTIETWQAVLPLSEGDKTVQLVRVGRVALYYLTPDQQSAGYWDNASRSWLTLPSSWLAQVQQIHAVADNKTLPTLLEVPLLEGL